MTAAISETMESAGDREGSSSYSGELTLKVGGLSLSVRARNVLKNAGIEYVGDLVQLTEDWLFTFPNCGRKTVQELRERLAELGLGFGTTLDNWNRPVVPDPSATSNALPSGTALTDLGQTTRAKLYLRADEIGLSQRARNVLRCAGVEFVGDLVAKTESDLRRLPSSGRLTVSEIKDKLDELGLPLGLLIADWNAEAAKGIREEQDFDNDSPIARVRRELNTIDPSEFLEDELRSILASVASGRNADMTLKQLGWSGKGQRTLESVGQEYSVTRERVRQVVARQTHAIRKGCFGTPRLNEALSIIRGRCPATAAELAAELRARGISKGDFDPSGLRSACDILQREFGLMRIRIGHSKIYVATEHAKRTIDFFRLCRRLTSGQGCANFDAACDELRIPEAERQRFRVLATVESTCEWLDSGQKWLFSRGVSRNRLSNVVAKVLSVAPRVNIAELRKAVARSRRLAVVPPIAVLANFVERFGLASVLDGRASAMSDFAAAIEPESIEYILVSVLRAHGPILGWDRFQELCVAAGMNPITFGIYVSGSPVVARVTRGIYSLIGADITPGAVEDLEREVANSRKSTEWGWSPRGTLWYALPITGMVLTAGSVAVAQFVADIADGEWNACFDGRPIEGNIKCSNRFLWGLRRPLVNAGAEPGDFAILEFSLPKRIVNITLGGEELVEMWESGKIDLPRPELNENEGDSAAEEIFPDD